MKYLLESTFIATVRGNPTFYTPFDTEEAALQKLDYSKFTYRLVEVGKIFNLTQKFELIKEIVG